MDTSLEALSPSRERSHRTASLYRDARRALVAWLARFPQHEASALLRAFRCYFGLKLLCTFHHVHAWQWSGGRWLQLLAGISTLALCGRRSAPFGALGWALLLAHRVALTWPYTLNHLVLELVLLLVLAVHPEDDAQAPGARASTLCSLLWGIMLSTWVFAALQKIGHGRYLNGESFAFAVLAERDDLGENLRAGLRVVDAVVGTDAARGLPVNDWSRVHPSGVQRAYFVISSWSVVAAELVLPVLALNGKTARFALPGLLVAQAAIGWVSGELDFALTALGVMNLGSTKSPNVRYALLSTLALVWAFWEHF